MVIKTTIISHSKEGCKLCKYFKTQSVAVSGQILLIKIYPEIFRWTNNGDTKFLITMRGLHARTTNHLKLYVSRVLSFLGTFPTPTQNPFYFIIHKSKYEVCGAGSKFLVSRKFHKIGCTTNLHKWIPLQTLRSENYFLKGGVCLAAVKLVECFTAKPMNIFCTGILNTNYVLLRLACFHDIYKNIFILCTLTITSVSDETEVVFTISTFGNKNKFICFDNKSSSTSTQNIPKTHSCNKIGKESANGRFGQKKRLSFENTDGWHVQFYVFFGFLKFTG